MRRITCRLLLAASLAAASFAAAQSLPVAHERHVRFGMPSPAKADETRREDYLIARAQYVLSYNDKKRTPNWVSWNLHKKDIGKADRGPFEPDPLLPKGFLRVTTSMYNGTGFNRGHMCPSADRSDSEDNNDPTFYMTNIIPQSPNNNQKGWERLESYCRDLARDGKDLHIVAGPFGVGGKGEGGFKTRIGPASARITVPSHTWKVILVLSQAGANPTKRTRAIAVWMPNDQSVGPDWTGFRVSVKEVEEHTGYTFFPDINPEVAEVIKDQVDDVKVEVRPTKFGTKKKKKPPASGP